MSQASFSTHVSNVRSVVQAWDDYPELQTQRRLDRTKATVDAMAARLLTAGSATPDDKAAIIAWVIRFRTETASVVPKVPAAPADRAARAARKRANRESKRKRLEATVEKAPKPAAKTHKFQNQAKQVRREPRRHAAVDGLRVTPASSGINGGEKRAEFGSLQ